MLDLDIRSLSVLAGCISMTMGVVLLGLRRNYPRTIQGLLPWALAPLVGACSTLVYSLEGELPGIVVVFGGNALLLISCGLFYFGSQRFYGVKSTWRRWGGIGVACLLAIACFLLIWPDYRMRVFALTTTLALLFLCHARLHRRQDRGFAASLTAGVLAFQALVLLARAVGALCFDRADTSRFTPSFMQAAYLAAFSFSVLLLCIGVQLLASERIRKEFENLANYDELTGTLTRRALMQAIQREIERWQRHRHAFSVLLLDIDHFKRINDLHGHLVGDQVLVNFAAAVREGLRDVDVLGRYGGEEFVVLLPETDAEQALVVAECARRSNSIARRRRVRAAR
jgi:diguanylate cyclase (GGDEF)-like protein